MTTSHTRSMIPRSRRALLRAAFSVAVSIAVAAVPLWSADADVVAWNTAMVDAIRAETTPPALAVRNMAIAHLAIADAAHTTDRPTAVLIPITGCAVASSLWPSRRADFEKLRDRCLADTSVSAAPEDWSRGQAIVTRVLASREGDGASHFFNYVPREGPGQWRRTPPFFRPPELPQWPNLRPFALANPADFIPPGPPALDSEAWRKALDEVRRVGGKASTERTADQALTAKFWSDFSYTTTPPGHWNVIAGTIARERHLGPEQTADLFAVLNIAMADAGIVCWQAKFKYNFWRPVTVLADEGWETMLPTPSHPEYPSGHSVFSGAAATVLADVCGSDQCDFTVHSDAAHGVERTFHRFSDAAAEIGLSRVYAGIHYRFSCDDGLTLGRAVAIEVLRWNRQRLATGQPAQRPES